jgi:4-hydroxybenzoate polyprenyltransferase
MLISLSIIYLNPYNILWCVLTVLGLATYTYVKKNFWFAGPFYNGWIVMLLPLVGFMAISGRNYSVLHDLRIWLLCGLTLFSYANFVLIGYLKDITADRETGYMTFPVKYGWNATVWAGDGFVMAGMVFCYLLIGEGHWIPVVGWIAGSLVAVSGQMTAHLIKDKVESNASYPIVATVRAFILWHIAVTVHFRPEWTLFGVFFYLAFEIILALRPEKEQI